MSESIRLYTVEEVRSEFSCRGVSVSEWARKNGLSAQLTHQILSGRRVGLRGQSHQIAVLLGLKMGVVGNVDDLKFAPSAGG